MSLDSKLKVTCYEDGAKHEKVGEHLQPDHPYRLKKNRPPADPVFLWTSFHIHLIRVFLIPVKIRVRDIRGFYQVQKLSLPAGFPEGNAGGHLQDKDGEVVEDEEAEKNEEGLLEGHQSIVCCVCFAVQDVYCFFVPV